jgi:Ca-activated chloride channel family protein
VAALAAGCSGSGADAGATSEYGVSADALPPPAPAPEPADGGFVDVGRNPFVTTAEDALSTFALDVDTGSYSVSREMVAQGYLPPADAVRTEEWVNAFDYGYRVPQGDDFAVVTGAVPAHLVGTEGSELVRVGLAARDVAEAARPPAAVTLVVDVSGSMEGEDRIGLVRRSLEVLAENLRPDDTVAVVTYGSQAHLLLPPTEVSDRATVLGAVRGLHIDGSTNLEGGLRLGYEQARTMFREDGVNAVVLASDGVANVGDTGPGSIVETIRQEGARGISLVSVGFGSGTYDDAMMEQLADQGDGFYSHVDGPAEAQRLFGDELTSTLTVVARQSKLQVSFDPAQVEAYRLLGYENRALADEDFLDDTVDAGEVGAGHTVTALYEVVRAPGASGDAIGTVDLRWELVADGGAVQQESWPLTTAHGGEGLELAVAVAAAAEVLRAEPGQAGDPGDRGVRAGLEAVLVEAERLAGRDVESAQDLVDLLRAAVDASPTG